MITASIVGREEELRTIRAALRDGGSLVLLGDPGIGKSTLLEAAAAEALADGFQVLRAAGVEFEALPEGVRAALIELETPEKPSDYRVGLHNFWVITRYNRSAFYASAVHDLAQALRNARHLGR